MAVRWDTAFRAEIRKRSSAVNKKFARARKLGYTKVPENIRMADLKEKFGSRYASRRELRRYIRQYERMKMSDLARQIKLQKGSNISAAVFKQAEQRRVRIYRKTLSDVRKAYEMKSRAAKGTLPFINDEISRLENLAEKLSKPASSESRIGMINEMYTREYSSNKKESFENSIKYNMEIQLDKLTLSDDPNKDAKMKSEIRAYINNTSVDQLINMNRNDDDFSEINDRYKKNEAYNAEDDDALVSAYQNIYSKIKTGVYDNVYGE